MSGGANSSFLANPRNFLANNILIVNLGGQNDLADRYRAGVAMLVNIVKSTSMSGRTAAGKTIPVYEVLKQQGAPAARSNCFRAYYLPYRGNDLRTMRLDPADHGNAGADFFFTDSLNGCSFASGPGLNPKVGHFNRTVGGQDGAAIDQGAIDLDIAAEFAGGTLHRIVKTDYKQDAADYATVLGIKGNAGWDFWCQVRSVSGMTQAKRNWRGIAITQPGYIFDLAANAPTQIP